MSKCESCTSAIMPGDKRCANCGRSIVAGIACGTLPGGAPALGVSPSSNGELGLVSTYAVHAIIGFFYGLLGFATMMFLLRRVLLRHTGDAVGWTLLFLIGFVAPAIYGFCRSYAQAQEEQERRIKGLKHR